jgi:GT2 family glycosyltransferase
VWRRTPWGQPRSIRHLPSLVPIPHAPYSGFFFNRKVVERIGLPNTEFVLYGDDTEFTARLPTSGGKIYLVPASSLEDMEASWNIKARFDNSFKGWLCGDSDLRAFYGARNRAYIDARQVGTCITYVVNRSVYLGVLRLLALKERRSERFRLLRSAIMDGEAGQLGPHPEHKLP